MSTTPDAEPPRQMARERHVTRRELIRDGGKILAAATAPTALSGQASADSPEVTVEDFANSKPNHAEITTDDMAFLERYRPLLDLSAVSHANRPTLYGWKVTSTDSDLDVGVYACDYAVQQGLVTLTSHAGDHEWIYVFVDSDTGEVDHVSYCAYHWLRGYVTEPTIDESGGGDHPAFRVANRYHNYIPLPEGTENGVLEDVEPLGNDEEIDGPVYSWLKNGLAEDMAIGAVHNPWLLGKNGPLDAWWSEERSGDLNRTIVEAWKIIGFGLGIGIRGSENADFGDAQV